MKTSNTLTMFSFGSCRAYTEYGDGFVFIGHTCFALFPIFDSFTGNEVLSKIVLPVQCSFFIPSDF